MAENSRIKKLDELLKPILANEKQYLSHTEKRLTAAGENYGSLMLAVEIKLKNLKTGGEETLNAVAKLIPPNEFLQKMFNIQVTFRSEVAFYQSLVPYLQQFQVKQGSTTILDCFPKFYGARLSLNPDSDVVDDDAVLLLENLKSSEFDVADRYIGFDFQTTELILENLAKFHAIPIALKLLRPEEFESEVMQPFFKERKMLFPDDPDMNQKTFEKLIETIKHDELCMSHLERIRELFFSSIKFFQSTRNCRENVREPFGTIVHTDLWVNNIMVKTGETTTDSKMVDFQLYEYSSPARDVLFLLYSSVEMGVVEANYEHFIRFYYNTFIRTLEEFECQNIEELFSFEQFEDEIKREAVEVEFLHCLMMVNPIMAYKGSVVEIEDLSQEHFFVDVNNRQREKSAFIIREFIKRNLI